MHGDYADDDDPDGLGAQVEVMRVGELVRRLLDSANEPIPAVGDPVRDAIDAIPDADLRRVLSLLVRQYASITAAYRLNDPDPDDD